MHYVKHLLQDIKKLKRSSTLLTVLTLLSDNTLERGMHLLKEEELIDLCRHRCYVHPELLAPFPKCFFTWGKARGVPDGCVETRHFDQRHSGTLCDFPYFH
jgi:hypothetical protein